MPRRLAALTFALATLALGAAALADRRSTVLSSQPFAAGALPGSPGIVVKTKGSDAHCGGVALTASVKKAKKPDKRLAAVFALKFPSGLDFDPKSEAKRQKSMERFDTWLSSLETLARDAASHFSGTMTDQNVTPADRIAAAARFVQVTRWTSHMIARAPIPKSLMKGEFAADAQRIYCDTLADKAAPSEGLAIDAAQRCRDLAASLAVGDGWWDEACAP
jgi:hypothetical protein